MDIEYARLVDAICRINIGWSDKVEGDGNDYRRAIELVNSHGKRVSGTFREPTELEQYRAALKSIAANTCCDRCREAALVAGAALTEGNQS